MMHVSHLGDYIGMESSVDLETDTKPPAELSGSIVNRSETTNRRSVSVRKCNKDLPPPLPFQTSTVMKRYCTDDGRLVIAEEKIQSPKFQFTALRSHGRLTIQLVNSGDDQNQVNDGDDDDDDDDDVKEVGKVDEINSGGGADQVAVVGSGECCNAAVRVAATGCLFVNQNQIHAMGSVQI